jgi:hypothetical protein
MPPTRTRLKIAGFPSLLTALPPRCRLPLIFPRPCATGSCTISRAASKRGPWSMNSSAIRRLSKRSGKSAGVVVSAVLRKANRIGLVTTAEQCDQRSERHVFNRTRFQRADSSVDEVPSAFCIAQIEPVALRALPYATTIVWKVARERWAHPRTNTERYQAGIRRTSARDRLRVRALRFRRVALRRWKAVAIASHPAMFWYISMIQPPSLRRVARVRRESRRPRTVSWYGDSPAHHPVEIRQHP